MGQMQHTIETLDKLRELIQDIEFAMLATLDHGVIRSRPMAVRHVERDDDLWFFSDKDSAMVHELDATYQANAIFSDPKHQNFVSVSGPVEVIRDVEKQKELWTPFAKIWFDGPKDPNLVLLKLNMRQAEYWDGDTGTMKSLFNLAKAVVGGTPDMGENEKITLNHQETVIRK